MTASSAEMLGKSLANRRTRRTVRARTRGLCRAFGRRLLWHGDLGSAAAFGLVAGPLGFGLGRVLLWVFGARWGFVCGAAGVLAVIVAYAAMVWAEAGRRMVRISPDPLKAWEHVASPAPSPRRPVRVVR